jgi:hypothetical protein
VRRALALAAVLGAGALAGCGGPPVDQVRRVGAFDRLDISGGVRVQVVQGDRPGVTVHGRSDVLDRVTTRTVQRTLGVAIHDRGIVIGPDPLNDVRVLVTAPRLHDVRVSGGGDIDLGELHADALHFDVRGTGDLRARGRVDTLDVQVHGAADGDFSALQARDARVEIHGASDMRLDVVDRLDVEIHGAGDVTYSGNPVVTRRISGAGDITQTQP